MKAQFKLQTLDNSYLEEAVICSKKAANTLMYVVSTCKKMRKASKCNEIWGVCNDSQVI
jgi:hypothetical protein